VLTAVAVAVKVELREPEAIVTEAGTVTALLLLTRLTTVALVATLDSVTVQASVPAPVSVALVQETALSGDAPCPVPLTPILGVLDALLSMSNVPFTAPATVGLKPIVSTAVCPGLSVIGALIPDTENPDPETAAPLSTRSAVPEDVSVTVWLVATFSGSVPNANFVALTVSAGVTAFSCNAKVSETPPALAVSIAVCVTRTDVAVAVNAALEAPAAIVTDAGTVTALLPLATLTTVALVAGALSVTVQASVPAPVRVAFVQETAFSAVPACPVPLSASVAGLAALLAIITDPLTAPEVAGSKPIVSIAV
jgi:hypothetical protein